MIDKKIKSLEDLASTVAELKRSGKRIVHCHGCFDITHYGHSQHFLDAKKQGDILIVTVTPDKYIQRGPGRPFFSQDIRVRQLSCLEPIDFVALNSWETAVETIKLLKPDIYAKGREVLDNKEIDEIQEGVLIRSNLSAEEEALKSVGGTLYLTDEMTFSSSRVINQISSALPEESKQFLEEIRSKYNIKDIISRLNSLKDLKILVLGDAILDKYDFCSPLGKSGKEDLISRVFIDSEIHLGGVFAIANYAANFSDNINLITCLGDNHRELIQRGLNPKINLNAISIPEETMVKQRFLDQYKGHKIFEIYNNKGISLSSESESKILEKLESLSKEYDILLVPDFGHGMISPRIRKSLEESDKFLALNCQTNGGNQGYNLITKYKRADFICLNDNEARMPFQDRDSTINEPIKRLSYYLNSDKIAVTLGKSGIVYYQKGDFYHSPVFTKEPLDTIGSGDAVLSLTSLLAYKKIEPELIPFLGNCIGGLATRIIGNRKSVELSELKKFVSYIMK